MSEDTPLLAKLVGVCITVGGIIGCLLIVAFCLGLIVAVL